MEKFETITLPELSYTEPETQALCEAEEATADEKGKAVKPLLKKLGFKSGLKFKPIPWKNLFNARNALVASCIALILVAGYLNVRFSTPLEETPSAPGNVSDQAPGEESGSSEENFFAQAVISRERVRDEAIDVLRELTEDESADAAARQEAYEQMNRLAEEISSEVNIENLVRSTGVEQCVAVVSGDDVNVIVRSDGLTPGEVAQIKEIVYLQTGVIPNNVKIIERAAPASAEG